MQQYKNVFTRLIKFSLSVSWHWFTISIIFTAIAVFASTLIPMFTRYAIDEGIMANNFNIILRYSLYVLLAIIISSLSRIVSAYSGSRFAHGVSHELRIRAFSNTIEQSLDFFDRFTTGQFISRITNDSERISMFLNAMSRFFINDILTVIIASYFMFTMNVMLAIISIVIAIIASYISFRSASMIRPLIDDSRRIVSEITSIASNDLANIKTVKGLALEERELRVYSDRNRDLYTINIRIARMRSIYGSMPFLLIGILATFILFYGSIMIIRGLMSIGELTAFMSYLFMLMFPLTMIGNIFADYQAVIVSARRLFELIDMRPNITINNNISLKSIRGEICFRNVWFGYVKGKYVIKNINLRIEPGEKIVIIGPPGSGKSTLLKLLMRFYEVDEGSITIDGIDIREINIEDLRRNIGYVPQEPYIFNRTIFENIAMDRKWITFDDVIRAAKIAKIHDFIETLPNKYNTIVGERGLNLSGGQRQRIAIARALVGDPKILLLDDPVSNLDAETEKQLVDDLEEVLRGKTAIIATQRISLTKLANRIIVMDNGEIVEEGTHDELIARKGLYYRIYMSFLGEGDRIEER
ncbi:ABC transporter related [Ignisphaera aggregans DSM 17230]|uniref:ABC transporter related n=1 Tax=Ignisphaera aggregans (strain DSM 17230 / JCM 13409 / AQ1.S1) TaxID=583356 RepID=E0SNH0_IGNAA|nr:ABC transporter related [Ignisphaera aggregans DSM 17230]